MISAFGVDHAEGDIEKAFGMGMLRTASTALGRGLGQSARAGAGSVGRAAGKNLAKPGMRTMGQGQVKLGQGLKRFSNLAARRPGAVGGTALGAAGVGTFGAGAALGSRRNQY